MDIKITGQHIELGQAIQEYIRDRIETHIYKNFDANLHSKVVLSKDEHLFHVGIIAFETCGKKGEIRADAEHEDVHSAVNKCVERVATQLKKARDRANDHHKSRATALDAELA